MQQAERQAEGQGQSMQSIGDQAEQAQPEARRSEGAAGMSGTSAADSAGDTQQAARTEGQEQEMTLQSFAEKMGVTPDKLIRMDVENDQGESLGEIARILRDSQSKLYMLVETQDFLGFGEDLAAVPAGDFSMGRDGSTLILPNVTEDQLEDMGYDSSKYDILQ
jgi:hypothetical protein